MNELTQDIPGSNRNVTAEDNAPPDWAQIITADLTEKRRGDLKLLGELLDLARNQPKEVTTEEEAGTMSDLAVRIDKLAKSLDSHREGDKAEHELKYNATNTFYFGWIEKLRRRKKTDAAGAYDILYARVDAFNQRKLLAEQRKRRQQALDDRAYADQLQAEADIAEAARIEAEAAAARARAPVYIEQKTQVAAAATEVAQEKKVDALLAEDKAEVSATYAAAKPADMVRARSDGGTLNTMGTEPFAEVITHDDEGNEVEGYDLLDKAKLWPFIKREEIDKALRAWAKTTGHKPGSMAGAKIGKRPKTRIGA